MVTIEFTFPGGRYHATPWDHSVNEGVVEWPPSPWRILRALLAVWHRKAAEEVDAKTMESLVDALASAAPSYALPEAASSHLRHYMPGFAPKKKWPHAAPNTTKVFDAFLHLSWDARLQVSWPDVELDAAQKSALVLLVERIGYLGRAESWAAGRLLDDAEDRLPPNCAPADQPVVNADAPVRVLAAQPPADYQAWHAEAAGAQREDLLEQKRAKAREKGKAVDKVKLTRADETKLGALLPASLFCALQSDTSDLQQQGWSQPPGSRWVEYLRPSDGQTRTPRRRLVQPSTLPTVARFVLTSQVLPRLTDAFEHANLVRRALQRRTDGAPVFSGHQPDGAPSEGHEHAFIFPEAHGRHGRITHLTVYAPRGFDAPARQGLEELQELNSNDRAHAIQTSLLAVGMPSDFGAGLGPKELASISGQTNIFGRSRSWVSVTPFVPTRHAKLNKRGEPRCDDTGLPIGSPEHDLRRLLQLAGFPKPAEVEQLRSTKLNGKITAWLDFRTHVRGVHGRRAGLACGFRLVFAEPVTGPIAVGFGAHRGLGLFLPQPDPCTMEA